MLHNSQTNPLTIVAVNFEDPNQPPSSPCFLRTRPLNMDDWMEMYDRFCGARRNTSTATMTCIIAQFGISIFAAFVAFNQT